MKSSLRIPASILAAILTSHLVSGCLDFTPITRIPTDGSADDATGTDDSAVQSACLVCASSGADAGGCAIEFAQCNSFPECKATVKCVVGQCFDPNANIGQCLTACEEDGGISSSQGPPNDAFAAFLECMSMHCQSVCLP
jgi:hypothetical protein